MIPLILYLSASVLSIVPCHQPHREVETYLEASEPRSHLLDLFSFHQSLQVLDDLERVVIGDLGGPSCGVSGRVN
jgi:hypothetical protein